MTSSPARKATEDGFVVGALAQPDSRARRRELAAVACRAVQIGLQNRTQPIEVGA